MDTADHDGLSDSERQHQEDVRRAIQIHVDRPWFTVTRQTLKDGRIRAWKHQYSERHVLSLIKLVYGTE